MKDPLSLPSAFPGGKLRRFQSKDLQAFQAYRSLPELARFQGWSSMSDAEATAFLSEMNGIATFKPGEWVQLAIADSSDRLLGDIGLFFSANGVTGEIGFTLAPAAQGRGIAGGAVRSALRLFFALTNAERVLGITDARNAPSIRLLLRAGFKRLETQAIAFRGEDCIEEIYVFRRDDQERNDAEARSHSR